MRTQLRKNKTKITKNISLNSKKPKNRLTATRKQLFANVNTINESTEDNRPSTSEFKNEEVNALPKVSL